VKTFTPYYQLLRHVQINSAWVQPTAGALLSNADGPMADADGPMEGVHFEKQYTKTKTKRDEKHNLISINLSKFFNCYSSPRTETCCWAGEGEGQVGQTGGSRAPLEDWDGVTDVF
jgi:hypothetical protein